MSNSLRPHGLKPTRLLHPWNFPGKSTGVGCHFLLHNKGKLLVNISKPNELLINSFIRINSLDFPHDAVDKNPPANAGDMGLILFGKIPHAMKQLCPCATTAEPML